MFKHTSTTVGQGSVGLSAAVFKYTQLGYNVLLPLVDNQSYDLAIEKDDVFQKVQVKTSSVIRNGNYLVQLKKVRHNKNANVITPLEGCDILFVLCSNGDCYSIPFDKLPSKVELRVSTVPGYKMEESAVGC